MNRNTESPRHAVTMRRKLSLIPLILAAVAAVSGVRQDVQDALDGITPESLRGHLLFLSHDLLEGRAPGTRGGDLTALYLGSQFARIGLGSLGGEYLRPVPLVRTVIRPQGLSLQFQTRGGRLEAAYPEELVVWTEREDTIIGVAGEMVFAGYGVSAPEFAWDDFKGRDVRGKVLLVLVGDPPSPPDDPDRFGGEALTYYGRWKYKVEEAERRGAAGVLLLHSPDGAGYPWSVVETSWTGARLSLPRPSDPPRIALQGWVEGSFGRRLLAASGLSLEELYVRAARRDFRPIPTGTTFRAEVPNRARRIEAANVAGVVAGRHPTRKNEVVVYTAHHDHLGVGSPDARGDSIFNGAYDNASGTAILLALAEAFSRLDPPPDRSIVFLATTAEEAGMLGAEHFVRRPGWPLARIVASINLEGGNLWGETEDVVGLGSRGSTLGALLAEQAARMGMRVSPERAPEKGFFYRADHFPFARAGIPAFTLEHGLDFRGRPSGWGEALLERYGDERYHRPGDEFDPATDLSGAVQQARLAFLVGYELAQRPDRPLWLPGSPFRAVQDSLLRGSPPPARPGGGSSGQSPLGRSRNSQES